MTKQFFAQVALDDVSAQGSYGIGLQIGQQLVDSKLAVKAEAVAKGIYDALNQNPPALELNEVAKALQELQQQASEIAQAQFKQIEEEGKKYLEENAKKDCVKVTETGLQYEVLVEGSGAIPTRQDQVRVHYTGTLIDGTVFDSSVKRGQPAEFPVSGVIAGWIEALSMMPVGSKWKLTIPHHLAYGERGAGASIPPFSTLVFEVELLDIL
ncbi:FKBP-type peptidyl-prolyl cis-trans isomerase [Histophilus somni]|uniref:Peptidyl-prolyl cis-trans isomerase n=1 Tax=Histophilus somni TaxID=731 RepID=A0AAX2S4H5_HISSO|nr:FKBP-type peptidyl-prolyl cis-trans isomerase [Histophilus somni]QEH09240.1 peptidylprolyl isomerase [Histophilus somni]QEH12104.1 peptidylprolyl isomerase [Histophilus somni]QEH25516.1 peptidylprolyl isomerase [Histophilus somni]QEH26581.1 peptidylprolyl isomerase [Histophilus somni]QEH50775.1 peptidylprolyl isomerase [Histophilus somni]